MAANRFALSTVLASALILGASACRDRAVTAPSRVGAPSLSSTTGSTLVECPTGVTRSVTALVNPLGGSVSLDGTSIALPARAVAVPTPITVTIPASRYMEVSITANGLEHIEFALPVTVTISYARCTRSDLDRDPLVAWYIDETTKAFLASMGGTDDKVGRTVTFSTGHLSGYAIAQRVSEGEGPPPDTLVAVSRR
jgi:hypothetical protein